MLAKSCELKLVSSLTYTCQEKCGMTRKFHNISLVMVQTRLRLKDKGTKQSKFVNKPVNVGFRYTEVENCLCDQLRRLRKEE